MCIRDRTYPAQAVCFRKVPGLEHAEFVRFGSMHRNTYVNAPVSLKMCIRDRPCVGAGRMPVEPPETP